MPDYYDPDYVAEMTYKERYADDEEETHCFEEPWAVYDPD